MSWWNPFSWGDDEEHDEGCVFCGSEEIVETMSDGSPLCQVCSDDVEQTQWDAYAEEGDVNRDA